MPYRPIADPFRFKWRGVQLPWLHRHGRVRFYESVGPVPRAYATNEVHWRYEDREGVDFFEWFVFENGAWKATHIIQGNHNWLLGELHPPRLIVWMMESPRVPRFLQSALG